MAYFHVINELEVNNRNRVEFIIIIIIIIMYFAISPSST
jgi:hypothetical protein